MELENFAITGASALGLITLLKWLISFIGWVWKMFLRPPKNLKEYGSWAMITGPTAGIGKALAFEVASKGLNLVLVGRNPSKLEETSREIQDKFNKVGHDHRVQVKNVVLDFAKSSGKEIADVIGKETEGLDVGVVINNAGLSYPYPRFFDEDALVWSTSKAELTSRLRFSSDILFIISPCLVLVFVFFVFLSKLSFTSFLKLWS